MAGSPTYLRLLSDVSTEMFRDQKEGLHADWTLIDEIWDDIENNPTNENLFGAAVATFEMVAEAKGQTIDEVIHAAQDLHINKNAGYAGANNPDPWANFRMCERFGHGHATSAFDGVLVRLSDKYIRTQNLRDDPTNERVGESLLDSLSDFGAYCLIAIAINDPEWSRVGT